MEKKQSQPSCLLFFLFLSSCIGTDPPNGVARLSFGGTTSLGTPPIGSDVHVYKANEGEKAALLDTVTTESSGRYEIDTVAIQGDAVTCFVGGEFVDPYISITLSPSSSETCTYIPDAEQVTVVPIHYLTHQAWCLMRHRGGAGAEAWDQARRDISAYWGCAFGEDFDIVDVAPIDLRAPDASSVTREVVSALGSGTVSTQAALLSQKMGYSAATRITLISLSDAGCDDLLEDGVYNGIGKNGAINLAGYVMMPSTYSDPLLGLGHANRMYLRSERNLTGIDEATMADQSACLGVDGGPLTSSASTVQEDLDITDPQFVPVSPRDGGVINGTAEIVMSIIDDVGIRDAAFVLPSEIINTTLQHIKNDAGEPNPKRATLRGTLETRDYGDGPITIKAIAHDLSSNEGTIQLTAIVANSLPQFEMPDDLDVPLRGVVAELRFCASGASLELIELVSPEGLTTRYKSDGPHEGCLIVENYDSSADGVDTSVDFTVRATTKHGRTNSETFVYRRDNLAPGEIRGCIFSDSPLVGCILRACLRIDAATCTAIDDTRATSDADGCFSMSLPDDVSGLLEVRAHRGTYIDGYGGHEVELGTFVGYTHVVPYTPSAEGTLLDHRSIHLWTAAADRWALANQDRYDSLEAAYADSYWRHSDHVGVDIATTYARDFVAHSLTSHADRTTDASNRLGLSLRARSFRAAQIALDNEMSADAVTSLDIDAAVLRSADSGLHDGIDHTGAPVVVAQTTFDANSLLRRGLANAIGASLLPENNPSDLTVAMYSQPGGFLDHLSTNPDALLFGVLPTEPFDVLPPHIDLFIVDADGNHAQTSPLRVDVHVWLQATLTDPAGFRVLNQLVLPEVELTCHGGYPPSSAIGAMELVSETPGVLVVRYPLVLLPEADSDARYDGTCTLHVRATDAAHNRSAFVGFDFIVDHTPPRTHVAPVYVDADSDTVASQTIDATWTAVDDLSDVVLVGCEVSHDAGSSTQAACSSFDLRDSEQAECSFWNPCPVHPKLTIDLGKCNTEALVRLWAEDNAGNRAAGAWQPANCDSSAPTMGLETSEYSPARPNDGVFHPETELYTRTAQEGEDFTGSQPEPFVFSLWHDEYFSGSLKVPQLRAIVSDPGDGGARNEQLMIWHEYLLNDAVVYTSPERRARANGEISLRLDPATLGAETQRSRPTDTHKVIIYARDLAGNLGNVAFLWRFSWILPDVYVYGCDKSPVYEALALAPNNTSPEEFYSENEIPIIEGRMFWAYRASGTAEHADLHVELGTGQVVSAITRLVEDRLDGILRREQVDIQCNVRPGHRFNDEDNCISGYLDDETESSIPGPNDEAPLNYAIGNASSQTGDFGLAGDVRYDFSARAALQLNYNDHAIFRSGNRYTGGNGRYSILRRPGFDESARYRICEPEPELPGGQLCYDVVDRQHWTQHTYVSALSVTVGSLSVTAELLINEGDDDTDPYKKEVRVVLMGQCTDTFNHVTSR